MKKLTQLARQIVIILIPLVMISAAYGLDRWTNELRKLASQTFEIQSMMEEVLIGNFLFTVLLVGFSAFVLSRQHPGLGTALYYTLIGVILTLLPFTLLGSGSPILENVDETLIAFNMVRLAILDLGFGSHFGMTANIITILGLLLLIRKSQARRSNRLSLRNV